MIPIWNDLWFPLILAPAEESKTLTLGSQVFIGQYVTNWNAGVLAALSLAILPVLALYVVFSRQLIVVSHRSCQMIRARDRRLGNMGRSHALALHDHPVSRLSAW